MLSFSFLEHFFQFSLPVFQFRLKIVLTFLKFQEKNPVNILTETTLNFYIKLRRMNIFTILDFSSFFFLLHNSVIHGVSFYSQSFCIMVSPFPSFVSVLFNLSLDSSIKLIFKNISSLYFLIFNNVYLYMFKIIQMHIKS